MVQKKSTTVSPDAPSVQTHIASLQSIIARMSHLGAGVKNWTAGITAALAVVSVDMTESTAASILLTVLPVLALMDSYYLGLERDFRKAYSKFVRRLHSGTLQPEEIFAVSLPKGILYRVGVTLSSFFSVAIWPFYLALLLAALYLTFIYPELPFIHHGTPSIF